MTGFQPPFPEKRPGRPHLQAVQLEGCMEFVQVRKGRRATPTRDLQHCPFGKKVGFNHLGYLIFIDFCWKKMGGECFLQGETPIWHSQILTQQLQRGKELKSDILRQKIHQLRLVTFFRQEMPWVFWWLARWISQYTFRKILFDIYGENIFEGLICLLCKSCRRPNVLYILFSSTKYSSENVMATSCAATSRNHLFSHKYSHQASTFFRPFIFSFYVLACITWNAFVFSTKYWYFFAWGSIYFRRKHSHPNCKADGDGNVVSSSIFGICSVSNFP